jgi:hypothetical protein
MQTFKQNLKNTQVFNKHKCYMWRMIKRRLLLGMMGVGLAQWYSAGLRAGWSWVRVPVGTGNFSLHHRVQTGSGTYRVSYPMGTNGSFPGDKVAGAWNWPLPQYDLIAWCSIKKKGTVRILPLSLRFTCCLGWIFNKLNLQFRIR